MQGDKYARKLTGWQCRNKMSSAKDLGQIYPPVTLPADNIKIQIKNNGKILVKGHPQKLQN